MQTTERIKQLKNQLEATLGQINDEYENDKPVRFDNLHEEFTVYINDCKVSLGSMDAYDKLQQCLTIAAETAEELSLDLRQPPVTTKVVDIIRSCTDNCFAYDSGLQNVISSTDAAAPNFISEQVYEAIYDAVGEQKAEKISNAVFELVSLLTDEPSKYL